jgi:hypothetical protein
VFRAVAFKLRAPQHLKKIHEELEGQNLSAGLTVEEG